MKGDKERIKHDITIWIMTGIDMAVMNTPDKSKSSTAEPTKRGMVLPFQPLSLAFDHVNYYVDMPAVSPFSISLFHNEDST